MNHIRLYFVGVLLLGSVLLLGGCECPSNSSGDTTPPGFLYVEVYLEERGHPSKGGIDIMSQNVSRDNIPSNLVIRVHAGVGDGDSGIKGITLATLDNPYYPGWPDKQRNLSFRCGSPHAPDSELTPVLEFALLPFTVEAPPSSSCLPTAREIDVVVDPIATTGCRIDEKNGYGPIDVEGFVRLIVTNGVGLSTESGTFSFSYQDVGMR